MKADIELNLGTIKEKDGKFFIMDKQGKKQIAGPFKDKKTAQKEMSQMKKDMADGNIQVMAQFKTRAVFYTKPSGEDDHTHMAILNTDSEEGVTTLDGENPHVHMIGKDGKVMEANGHTHKLSLTETVYTGDIKKVTW